MTVQFDVIVAADEGLGIGAGGRLPWRLRSEMAYFTRTTKTAAPGLQNAVFSGRINWESIPDKYRPLPDRLNVVLTRRPDYPVPPGVLRANSIDNCLAQLAARDDVDRVFCIGGGKLYAEAIEHPACARILFTRVLARFDCDTFFPAFEHLYELERVAGDGSDDGIDYRIEIWRRLRSAGG